MGGPTAQAITAAEIGFLVGGRGRVVETALTAALERGRVRVEEGLLVATGRPSGDPLERAVTELADGAEPAAVRWRLWDSAAMADLEAQLVRRGLLVSERRRRAVWPVLFAGYVALLVLGLARLFDGLADKLTLGVLVGELLIALVLTIGAGAQCLPLRRRTPTRAGEAAVGRSRMGYQPPPTAAIAVALGGLGAQPDEEIARLLRG